MTNEQDRVERWRALRAMQQGQPAFRGQATGCTKAQLLDDLWEVLGDLATAEAEVDMLHEDYEQLKARQQRALARREREVTLLRGEVGRWHALAVVACVNIGGGHQVEVAGVARTTALTSPATQLARHLKEGDDGE